MHVKGNISKYSVSSTRQYDLRINLNLTVPKHKLTKVANSPVLFTDESSFANTGRENRHNYHHYADQNPRLMREDDHQHRFKVNVWAGICGEYVIGPHFLEGNLTGNGYLQFLQNDLLQLQRHIPPADLNSQWFQHDGAPAHSTLAILDFTALVGHAVHIWNDLRSNGFSSLRPRALNQDALENLFGAIRSGCGDNPTVFQFIGSLKTQILNGLTKQALSGTNCEKDDNVLLSNLKSFLRVEETHTDSDAETGVTPLLHETSPNVDTSDLANAVSGGNEETLSVAYVSGFIAKKILGPDHQCDDCLQLLCWTSMEAQNLFIAFKEWTDNENILMYPSENLVIAVGQAVTVLENFIQKHGGKPDLSKCSAIEIKNVVNFSWFSCELHCNTIIEGVIKAVCRIGIPWWCKRQNRNIIQEKKDARATKRKIRKFKNQ
ncbi:hypothetical protein NQ315_008236 [Exocentrus adspersus]|uniref:Transposable element P transposase-like RNase H C-terminal domain-containing protein n=1 Tax=Exocentrus adspersus TaxID=1586481 RepID=A0AAV8VMA6_9CUCU|nr:hypothetical protein NQ315_008236 [Exocentrus adspersus]